MRAGRWTVLVVALFVAVFAMPADAADPPSGTLSSKQRVVRWSGGPYHAPRPVGCHVPSPVLYPNDPTCDAFFVRVDLMEAADIKVHVAAARPAKPCCEGPAPVGGDDYDVYVWSSTGALIAEANEPNEGVETLIFTHDRKRWKGPYEIEVIPFMVAPGSTYKASAQVLGL